MGERQVNVHFLPQLVAESDLAGSVVIVVDLLRASTTICEALAAGATEVVPFLEVEEAIAAAKEIGRAKVVLGGERKGGKIAGFDLGNSPSEYTSETVGGRPVYITTTNGTRALAHARAARRVFVGAFVNLSAVAACVINESRVDILCAGTDGEQTFEDILAAGAIVDRMQQKSANGFKANEAAQGTRDEWQLLSFMAERERRTLIEQLAIELRSTQGGRNLLSIGLDRDLLDCAQIERLSVVPELKVREWRIRPA
jgi:2-phosphosulfolactate phosphatase